MGTIPASRNSIGSTVNFDLTRKDTLIMEEAKISNIFTYHPPFGTQQSRYILIREDAKVLAHAINNSCPESREKSLAITSLQQTVMWANASIAINEREETTFDPDKPHPPPLKYD
jgi:hypothetical protein